MVFGVDVEWDVVVAEHMTEFVSYESADIVGICTFKPHVEPSIGASLFGLSVSLSPIGSEDTEAEFLVVVQLELFRPIHGGHLVNESIERVKEGRHVLR